MEAHVEFWLAIATVLGTVAVGLFRMGQKWGKILTRLDDLHSNQQALADKDGIALPHPYVERRVRERRN